jgi:hypothetical protein
MSFLDIRKYSKTKRMLRVIGHIFCAMLRDTFGLDDANGKTVLSWNLSSIFTMKFLDD